jgi:outer membrane protein
MANTRSLLSLAVLCGLYSGTAVAQEGLLDTQQSLLDIYQRALQNDPSIREAEATYLATAEVRPQARSTLLPTLSFGSTLTHRFSESQTPAVEQATGVTTGGSASQQEVDADSLFVGLTQTLFDWGRYATLRQADKRVARAETVYQTALQDLLLRVSDVYFDVLAAEDTLAAAVVTREARGRQLEQAQRRFEVGLIAITDVQEVQAGFDQAVALEIAAQRLVATSREFLREIIGESVPDLAGPRGDMPLLTPDPADEEQWVATALEQNLALVSSRIAADIAQDDIAIQRAGRLPTLNLTAGYNDSTQDTVVTLFDPPASAVGCSAGSTITQCIRPTFTAPEGYNWQLELRFPIYTGGLNRSRIQQSVYTHRAATEALERVARQTERQARDAYLGVLSEISRVMALQQAVESSRTALRAGEAGFEVGTRTTVDVLTLQDNLRQQETQFARSRYDYVLNVLRLKQAAGSLAEADIEQVDGWLE